MIYFKKLSLEKTFKQKQPNENMFKKKTCKNCGKKINSESNFCPNCGINLKKGKEKYQKKDWGMLGKDDNPKQEEILPGMSGGMLGKMLQGAMKMLEKEMQKDIKQNMNQNFKLMINGKEVNLNQKPQETKKLPANILKDFSKYPKHEPKTNIKRIENKLVYELNIPEVKSLKDVSIQKLENSIEIKAISKNKAYKKIIPFNLPILNYELSKDKLVLEMKED